MTVEELLLRWKTAAGKLEREADDYDQERIRGSSKYFTSMTSAEQTNFNRLCTLAYECRLQRDVYRTCINQLQRAIEEETKHDPV